ncbi:unnamed protein product [Parajaminaea phylloscopi]
MTHEDGPPSTAASTAAPSVESAPTALPESVSSGAPNKEQDSTGQGSAPAVLHVEGTEQPTADMQDPVDAAEVPPNDEAASPEAEAFYPAFDLAGGSLEAFAAAQIAAGLGDFDFGSTDPEDEQTEAPNGANADSNADTAMQDVEGDGNKRGLKRPHESMDEQSVHGQPSQPASRSMASQDPSATHTGPTPPAPASSTALNATLAPQAPVQPSQATSRSETPASTTLTPTASTALQRTALAKAPLPQMADGKAPASNTAPSAGTMTVTPAASRAAPATPTSTAPVSRPPTVAGPTATVAAPRPPASSASSLAPVIRPIAPPIGTMPRPMLRAAPQSRPPPPFPRPGPSHFPRPPTGAAPPFRPRPPGPALPAAALFSATPPPGAPSFAALLSTLGPQDLAMVAHAAMGLDANGNPLPGNEESHKALADAMRRLRESTSMRPPPPTIGPQPFRPRPTPPPTTTAKPKTPRKSPSASATPKPVPPKPVRPPPPPIDPEHPIDALPLNQGNPLEEKRPLIAGPKPDRAPPRPGPPPEKRFQCPKCDRAFARAYNLNTHLSTHDPDPIRSKPFPCPYPSCKGEARSFSRKHDLQRHIASTHEAEPEPLIEEQDENGDMVSTNLLSMGLGAPGRKFRCECGRAFVRRDALRRHNCEAMKALRGTSEGSTDFGADMSPSGLRSRMGLSLSGQDDFGDELDELDDMADFDAVAASLAESVAAEMRAAQAHVAARGDSDEPEEVAARKGPVPNVPSDDERMSDDDDAIKNFASEITGDLNLQLGLGADEDESPELPAPVAIPSSVQAVGNAGTAGNATVRQGDEGGLKEQPPSVAPAGPASQGREADGTSPRNVEAQPPVNVPAQNTSPRTNPQAPTADSATLPTATAVASTESDALGGDISLDDQQFEDAAAELMAQVTASMGETADDEPDEVEGSDDLIDSLDITGLIPDIPGLDDLADEEAADASVNEAQADPSTSEVAIPAVESTSTEAFAPVSAVDQKDVATSGLAQPQQHLPERIKQETDDESGPALVLPTDTSVTA